jgi:hypothetical protein
MTCYDGLRAKVGNIVVTTHQEIVFSILEDHIYGFIL